MAATDGPGAANAPALGIAFILFGMVCISINDVLVKQLSGDYPLHELVFARSAIGLVFTLFLVRMEGGLSILRTRRPFAHLLRGLMVVIANMTFFTALAVMPLSTVTALFFVAPLFITLLSIPFLGERVGALRLMAVLAGFLGVLIMVRPGSQVAENVAHPLVMLLPVLAAFFYASMQIMTRRLGFASRPSALAVYLQLTFIMVSGGFWLVAGDGRFAEGLTNESLLFLLRAWVWPAPGDGWMFLALGVNSAGVGYALSRAYTSADAAVIAPFEYVALPLAIFWGWLIWGELPGVETGLGIALILGAGLFVFLREQRRARVITRQHGFRR